MVSVGQGWEILISKAVTYFVDAAFDESRPAGASTCDPRQLDRGLVPFWRPARVL